MCERPHGRMTDSVSAPRSGKECNWVTVSAHLKRRSIHSHASSLHKSSPALFIKMTSSASSTYFQGGDYVELLSAQGKAPAATWKLHGKILKSFEKAIKGNAFQLDGSTETKMQLPKTATTTTQSLGLSQRFLVFQLSIPFTRSLSIEIGFSDFQKIRRRFVFASAFRETAMTSLHVQIPFDARVTRDQWINLVFDLQALTETYFAGSTFRSMESICISGSCKLKRVFTMKDAPVCDLAALQHQQQVANGKLTQRRAVGLGLVAGYTDMKDIPKQFLFSSGGPGPIPTEYFVVATISNAAVVAHGEAKESGSGHHATSSTSSTSGGRHTNGSMGQARGKSAPLGAQKQKPLLVKKASSTRPVSSSSVATTRPKTEPPRAPIRSEVQAASPLPSPLSSPVAREKDQSRRSLSSSAPSRSVDSPLQQPLKRPGTAADSTGRGVTSHIRLSNDQPPRESSARPPLSSNKREVSQHEDHLLQPGHDAHLRTSTKKNMNFEKRSPRNQFSDDDEMELTPYAQASRSSSSSSSSSAAMEPRNLHRSSSESKTNKEVHRRAIIAEIQQKLDILSDDDELEAERNTMLFLERTSLIIAPDSPQELPVKTTQQVGDKTQAGDESVEQELLVDLQPRRLRSSGRKLKTKSIFAFADDSDEDGGGGGGKLSEKLEMKKRITKLFDFESLLDSPMSTQRDASTSEQVLQKSSSSNSNFKTRDGYSTSEEVLVSTVRNGSSTLSEDEEEDQALAQLLIAKRNARRQQQQLVTVAPEKIMQQPTKLREVPRNSRADQQRLSVDDLTQEEAQDEELNGGAQDEEEEEEENLSIDL